MKSPTPKPTKKLSLEAQAARDAEYAAEIRALAAGLAELLTEAASHGLKVDVTFTASITESLPPIYKEIVAIKRVRTL